MRYARAQILCYSGNYFPILFAYSKTQFYAEVFSFSYSTIHQHRLLEILMILGLIIILLGTAVGVVTRKLKSKKCWKYEIWCLNLKSFISILAVKMFNFAKYTLVFSRWKYFKKLFSSTSLKYFDPTYDQGYGFQMWIYM